MSCSKIFSDNFPELTYEIIKLLRNDFSTLHSCILVNRFWCRLATPILWENPFSFRDNYKYFEIYSQYLNDDLKTGLKKDKIIKNSLPSNTLLFNYYGFLKHMDIYEIVMSVIRWIRNTKGLSLTVSDYKRISDICISLFKIFIENEIHLHTLELEYNSQYSKIYEIIFELILQNQNFIHNIKNLKLCIKYNDRNPNTLIKDSTLQIIKSHQNLKKILFGDNNLNLYKSLFLSEDFNCSNTLNTIIFYRIDLRSLSFKIFERLNVLESVHIVNCSFFDDNFIQQIINLTKPFKLKTLFMTMVILQIKPIHLLLQKSGCYIENLAYGGESFRYDLSLKQQLSEIILKYCKNIKYLKFTELENQDPYQVFKLIENIKQYLNYLSINILEVRQSSGIISSSSMILQNLGHVLPSKLEYLNLILDIKESDFKVFLENSRDIFINKLLIMQMGRYDILHYTKEFIMKEKRVKYLAIKGIYKKDLYSFKDEVNEFKLHNIRVQDICKLQSSEYPYNLMKIVD
ncbi:hypothetical protein RhiirC2_857156 [Rhizophagus irregularis]|uniref:F-box domain-containing protein n=1 Tax=Rhizophagus irregularis TaxID=588596 RepID=A0A2N1MDY9_9GLOM|nr:hypothetical protein RhiirC2_857156 [Rhizophagus irregularis]